MSSRDGAFVWLFALLGYWVPHPCVFKGAVLDPMPSISGCATRASGGHPFVFVAAAFKRAPCPSISGCPIWRVFRDRWAFAVRVAQTLPSLRFWGCWVPHPCVFEGAVLDLMHSIFGCATRVSGGFSFL
jgi:hypothetical protein